ncbi:MAG: hypothetical protein ACYDBJ_18020 [Aggregatilineales bacterium]
MNDLPPILHHRYMGHLYQIKIMPDGVEVERLATEVERVATGMLFAAKSRSFKTMLRLLSDNQWNIAAVEILIDRYEKQLIIDQDKP